MTVLEKVAIWKRESEQYFTQSLSWDYRAPTLIGWTLEFGS